MQELRQKLFVGYLNQVKAGSNGFGICIEQEF